ncbi:MAG: tRNA lysidine(34) synthetase TilS, partial [Gammaproteobacteria bacterium]|nr:tRNA lysidine(34) synthetase TilS [Gammaproteobacteria bacterium]
MSGSANLGFSLPALKQCLHRQLSVEPNSSVYLAYSGGLDSHVLLHALSALAESYPFSLLAIHVNHSLQPESNDWATHCQKVCDDIGVSLVIKTVTVSLDQGESLEAAARDARYAALAEVLPAHGLCMTAQHGNDQSETLLLQLLRGAGVHGLASMPRIRSLSRGKLLRPLLSYSRDELHTYAVKHELNWLEDPSNQDSRFDRNYLRNEILPALRQRWPGMDKSLSRSARHAASAALMLDETGLADLLHCQTSGNHSFPAAIAHLCADLLCELSPEHQVNALRCWVRINGLNVPGDERLQSFIRLLAESPDKGSVAWQDGVFRLYDNTLWLCSSQEVEQPEKVVLDRNINDPLQIPYLQQDLCAIEVT